MSQDTITSVASNGFDSPTVQHAQVKPLNSSKSKVLRKWRSLRKPSKQSDEEIEPRLLIQRQTSGGRLLRRKKTSQIDSDNDTAPSTDLSTLASKSLKTAEESLVLFFKVFKSNKPTDKKLQLLVISKSDNNFFLYRLTSKSGSNDMKIVLRLNLQCLLVIDGKEGRDATNGEGESREFTISFKDDQLAFSQVYNFCADSMRSKKAILWCLIQLCLQYLHFLPKTTNLSRAELGLIAAQYNFESLCPQLNTNSPQETPAAANIPPKLPPSASATILSTSEEAELYALLKEEALDTLSSGELIPRIMEQIQSIENETEEQMRMWEARCTGVNSDDPVEKLVLKLEGVEGELDGWMSNYNEELKTMRKGIQKIEQENNRLQVKSRNQRKLKEKLASVLSRYNVDIETQQVLDNAWEILFVDCLEQVENNPQQNSTALHRLSKVNTPRFIHPNPSLPPSLTMLINH